MNDTTKKRSNATVTMAQTDTTLTFNVLGAGSISLNLAAIHPDVLARAAIHGLKQRISDAAALPCNPDTGKPASPSEKFESLSALVEHYNTGTAEWARTRAAGEGTPRAGKTLQAIANVYKLADEAAARAYVEGTAKKRGIEYKEALALWKKSDKIREELARMEAAIPAAVDADTLIDELE